MLPEMSNTSSICLGPRLAGWLPVVNCTVFGAIAGGGWVAPFAPTTPVAEYWIVALAGKLPL